MSTNFHICASRECTVNKTGEEFTQIEHIDVWQTPSDCTHKMMASGDPIQAYKDWVLSVSHEIEGPIFDDEDPFKQIGTELVHPGKEHIKDLEEELSYLTKNGWDITYEAW